MGGGRETYGSYGSGFGTLVHLYHSSNIKRSYKTAEIKVFLYFFCLMMEGFGAGSRAGFVLATNGSGCRSGGQKHTDTKDLDPNTAFIVTKFVVYLEFVGYFLNRLL